jgi:uncharacterized protein
MRSITVIFTIIFTFFAGALAEESTISVTGTGNVLARADLTQVRLALQRQDRSAGKAHSALMLDLNKVQSALRESRARNVRTSGLTLYPVMNETRVSGYESTAGVVFDIAAKDAGRALERAIRAGANRVDSLQSFMEPRALRRAEAEALQLAAADARGKAVTLASSLDQCIGKARALATGNEQQQGGPGLLITTGQETVMAVVTATYDMALCAGG